MEMLRAAGEAVAGKMRDLPSLPSLTRTGGGRPPPTLAQLREEDEKYPALPQDPEAKAEEEFRLGKITEARAARKTKILTLVALMPLLFVVGLVALSYYSFALVVHVRPTDNAKQARVHLLNFMSHFLSFAVFFGTMGVLLVALIVFAPVAVDRGTIVEYSNWALGIFFGVMFIGAVYGIYRAHSDRQFLTIDLPSVRVRFNFDNTIAVASLLAELFSMIAFVFQPQIPWTTDSEAVTIFRNFVFDFGVDTFTLAFWGVAGVVAVFFVMVIVIVGLHGYVGMSLELLGSSWIVNIGFPFLGETLFIPVATVLMSALNCTKVEGSDPVRMALNANSEIECWTGEHRLYSGLALIALMSYTPTALFYFTRLNALSDGAFVGDKLDIKFTPVFYMWATLIRCVLAGVSTFLSARRGIMIAGNLAGAVVLMGLNIRYRPCCINVVNRIRTLSYATAAWASVSAFFALAIDDNGSWASFIFWSSGTFILLTLMVISLLTHTNYFANVEAYAFGAGKRGELGLGSERNLKAPVRNAHLSEMRVRKIVSSYGMNFAIVDDEEVVSANRRRRRVNRRRANDPFAETSPGASAMGGKVYTWGIGDLLTVDPPAGLDSILVPTQSPSLSRKSVTDIVFGVRVAFAITESGAVYMWTGKGRNESIRAAALRLVNGPGAAASGGNGGGGPNGSPGDRPRARSRSISSSPATATATMSPADRTLSQLGRDGNAAPGANSSDPTVAEICRLEELERMDDTAAGFASARDAFQRALMAIPETETPTQLAGELGGEIVTSVVVSPINSVFFTTASGRVYAMGNNSSGILGLPQGPSLSHGNDTPRIDEPVLLGSLADVFITRVSCSATAVFALADDGSLYTWGSGRFGVLGHGDAEDRALPTLVESLSEAGVDLVEAVPHTHYAIVRSGHGKVYMWGSFEPITPPGTDRAAAAAGGFGSGGSGDNDRNDDDDDDDEDVDGDDGDGDDDDGRGAYRGPGAAPPLSVQDLNSNGSSVTPAANSHTRSDNAGTGGKTRQPATLSLSMPPIPALLGGGGGSNNTSSSNNKKKNKKKKKKKSGGGRTRQQAATDLIDCPLPTEVHALMGIRVVRLVAAAEPYPVVVDDQSVLYRIVYKGVAEGVNKAVDATAYLTEEADRAQKNKRGHAIEASRLHFGKVPYLVARRLLLGSPAMAVDANANVVVAAVQDRDQPGSRRSEVHVLHYRLPRTDYSNIVEYRKPLVTDKPYILNLGKVEGITAGRSHINLLARK